MMDHTCKEMDMKFAIHTVRSGLLLAALILVIGLSRGSAQFISGTVSATDGHPLSGVSVQTQSGQQGTVTAADGTYSLLIEENSPSLTFSKPAFLSKTVFIGSKDSLDVVLQTDVHGIDKVIDLGWTQKKQKYVTGAVSVIAGSQLARSPVANLTATLAGRLSGLTTQETTSELSRATTNLYIRGFSTSRAGQPLVMIDGVMVPYKPNQTLDYISPDEIESIELLKDGVTQSMYGILGGNGVLLIKTKKGRQGPLQVRVRVDHAVQQVTTSPEMLSSGQYAALRQEAWANDYSGGANYQPLFTPEDIKKYQSHTDPLYPDHNWLDYYFKKVTSMQRVGVNAAGGNERVQFYSNLNLMYQHGFFHTDQSDYNPNPQDFWMNFRTNVDLNINQYLSAFVHIAGNIKREHTPGEGNSTVYASIFQLPPTMYGPLTPLAIDSASGKQLPDSRQVITSGDVENPTYGMLNRRGYHNHTVTNIFSHFGLNLDLGFLTKGLTASGLFAYQTNTVNSMNTLQDYRRMKRNTSEPDELIFDPVYSNENSPLAYSKGSSHYYHLSYQARLNYQRRFGKSQVGGVAYAFYQNLKEAGGWYPFNRFSSGAALNYDYDGRYMLVLNGGYSGSGQFSRGQRYTFTPGVGLAWSLKDEPFMESAGWLTQAKIRASWANTATDQNGEGRYAYLDDIRANKGGPISYLQYDIDENHFGNPDYAAEIIRKRNIGLDVGLFNKWTLSVDLFDAYTDNMVVGATNAVPLFQGRPLDAIPDLNIGEYENKGYEISLDFQQPIGEDWYVQVGGHFSHTQNKIRYNAEAERAEDYAYRYRSQGFPVGQAFGYMIDYSNGNGYINTADELEKSPAYETTKRLGDFLYVDTNGDGQIDDRDRVPLGTGSIPNNVYGVYGEVGYKHFDLYFLFQGVDHYRRLTMGWGVQPYYYEGIYSALHQHAWTPQRYESGAPITYPALSTLETASDEANNFFLYDKSYLRLKNVQLSYSLPLHLAEKIGAGAVRVIFSGQNLLTWDHMKTDDFGPEGGGYGAIPVYRVYNFGLDFTF